MNAHMGYLLCQYSSLKLLELILIALMVAMFYMLIIAVVIRGNLLKKKKKMPGLGVLCKMCDVRVCIALTVMVAIAFITILIAILIMMN